MKTIRRVLLMSLLCVMGSLGVRAQIATVGVTKASHHNGSAKWSASVSPAAGDTLVVGCDYDAGIRLTGVTDTAGDTFVAIGPGARSASFGERAYIATSVRGGTTTVTCTAASAPHYNEIYVTELAGVNSASPIDSQITSSGSTSPATATVTTTFAHEFLWAFVVSGQVSDSGGWTTLSVFDGNLVAGNTNAYAGNVSPSFPVTMDSTIIVAALIPAGLQSNAAEPISVSVSPTSGSVQVSKSEGFTAAVQNDTGNAGVSWSLSGAGCSGASCGTLTAVTTTSVTYDAPASVPTPAVVTLTATSVSDGTKSASATITVTAAPPPISVSVNPTSASVRTSQSTGFAATVQNDSANKGVIWSLSGSGCSGAACGTLTVVTATSVTFNAPASVPTPPTVTVKATSVSDATKSASATVTVTAAPPPISVSVNPSSASVQVSQSTGFTASVQNDPANRGVTWSLSGSGCSGASCGTLTAVTAGSVTFNAPASAPSPDTVTLSATSVSDNTKSGSATITITSTPPPISVSINPTSLSLQTSQSSGLSATVQNDSANAGVSWSLSGSGCSGASCGSLSNQTTSSATYTAPASVPTPPTVTLTATSVSDTTKSASATITNTSSSSQLTLNGVTLFILNTQSGIPQPISPTKGNLLIVSYIGGPGDDLVGVTDNKGNTYLSSGQHGTSSDGGECWIFYAANATPGVTSITFHTATNGNFDDADVYDVSGASSAPLDTAVNISNQHESSFGPITGPSITASTAGGIIIANVGIETNTLTGSSSPWTFDPQDQNNGWAHVLNSSPGSFSVTWSTNQSQASGGVGYWGGIAAAFRAAP